MKRILLIEPPVDVEMRERTRSYEYLPPLWAVALATYIRKNSPRLKIKILDGRLINGAIIKQLIEQERPDLVGLSPKFPNYISAIRIARFAKKNGAKVIFGGAHVTHLSHEILRNRGLTSGDYCVDGIIREDGEEALLRYIIGWLPEKINNLIWQEGCGKIRENPVKLLDLNKLPSPDFSLVDLPAYFKEQKVLPIYSQKGCSWRIKSRGGCLFCGLTELTLRFKKPEKCWDEIRMLQKKYGAKVVWDSSENFLNDLDWFEEFCRASLKYPDKPRLKVFMRMDGISAKIAKMLKYLNVAEVLLGVESGSQKSLSAMGKGSTVKNNLKSIEMLHKTGIRTFFCFVLGAPGESPETASESVKLAKKLIKLPMSTGARFNTLTPYPGSSAWKMLLKKTKGKYRGQDLINWPEVWRDWVDNFCQFSSKKYTRILKEARMSVGQT